MRVEVGVDVVGMARIQRAVERFGERFLQRIYTPAELAYSQGDVHQWEHLAARFAAKEAASKALGTGMVGVGWKEFEVQRLPSGKPTLHLSGRAALLAEQLGLGHWAVSLAHDGEANVAVATVIAIGGDALPVMGREETPAAASATGPAALGSVSNERWGAPKGDTA